MLQACGVDFGTSNSTVGWHREGVAGQATLLSLEDGKVTLPSVVFFNHDEDEVTYGRAALTAYRGYGSRTLLFRGFPDKVDWRRVALSSADIGALLYANYPTWVELSGGSRLVRDGALNVGRISIEDVNVNVAG